MMYVLYAIYVIVGLFVLIVVILLGMAMIVMFQISRSPRAAETIQNAFPLYEWHSFEDACALGYSRGTTGHALSLLNFRKQLQVCLITDLSPEAHKILESSRKIRPDGFTALSAPYHDFCIVQRRNWPKRRRRTRVPNLELKPA
ncbi:MAG: hypothetical protein WA021_01850 [Minisyncoccia bacterium]